jgi:uncharacterized NAD(P)/FAD-binding protein YdhS
MTERTVIIAGGGASGLLLAHALVRAGAAATVVEPRAGLGAGVAYSTPFPCHVLNVPAAGMSALAGRPDHFVAWLAAAGHDADPAAFVPRSLYGAYLAALADEARALGGPRFRHVRARAVDAEPSDDGVRATCDDGTTIDGDAFVVAVGNANPSPWPNVCDAVRTSPRFFDSAWSEGAFDGAATDAVVLLGTGLTAVDAVLGLRHRGHRGPIVMVSRRGLLPHEHRLFDRPPALSLDATTIADVIAAGRDARRSPESDWRLAVDALRSETNARWAALGVDAQRRFVRHVMPFWNVHRHRMAPQAAKTIAQLLADGTLRMIAGRTGALALSDAGIEVPVQLRGGGDRVTIAAQRVVNCSGPEHDITKRTNPLLRRLVERGSLVPHPLLIGSRVASDGALIDAAGIPSTRFYAIGPVRFGTLIETTAIPEIRQQVHDLAGVLLGDTSRSVREAGR